VGGGGSTVIVRGIEAQRSFMDGFSAHGIDNPVKVVTSKGFQEYLVKGIIEDDLLLGFRTGIPRVGFSHTAPVPVYTVTRGG